MTLIPPRRVARGLAAALCAALLMACASNAPAPVELPAETLAFVGEPLTGDEAPWSSPLTADAAVALTLERSAELAALKAEYAAYQADIDSSARPFNPRVELERVKDGDGYGFSRALSVNLFDLITWPHRAAAADEAREAARLTLARQLIQRVNAVREGWVRAVSAEERLQQARRVMQAAEAGDELARRLQQAGHFSPTERHEQQDFLHDALTDLADAEHAAQQRREQLIRLMGLPHADASRLRLAPRLPDMPSAPLSADALAAGFHDARLDVRLAQQQERLARLRAGETALTPPGEVSVGVSRASDNERGLSLEVPLPLFDTGDAPRDAAAARAHATHLQLQAVRADADSRLREAYATYTNRYDLVMRYERDILPQKKARAEQLLLRYNGMFASVFDLLADARDQSTAVIAAIRAREQFWIADTRLHAAFFGTLSPGADAP